jgi:O-antigen ligase
MPFVLVVHDQLISPFIVLFCIAIIPFIRRQKHRAGRFMLFLLLGFYVLHVISLEYSVNWEYARADLMTKLSYVVFPLVALLVSTRLDLILKGIRWGLIIASAFSMVFSFVLAFIIEGGFSGEAFKANIYGLNMHPSYLALIFIISTAFIWSEKMKFKGVLFVKIAYSVLLIISIFYLRSLGAFVCVAGIICILPIWKALKSANIRWYLLIPVYFLCFFIAIKASPKIENDINTSLSTLSIWKQSPERFLLDNKNNMESNTVRLVTWTLSSRIVAENPCGVGIGDVKDVLKKRYRSYGYTYYAYYELNPHNQFLQSGIAIGWIGVILLLSLLLLMLFYSFKANHLPLFIAALCILISCLFESILERQVGVILTSLLLMYLVLFLRNYKMVEKSKVN